MAHQSLMELFIVSAFFSLSICAGLNIPVRGQFHGSGSAVGERMGVVTEKCITLEQQSLTGILGAAYNPRYMSVNPPPDLGAEDENINNNKRKTSSYRPFAVDEGFALSINEDTPAWEVDHFKSDYFTHGKVKRSTFNQSSDDQNRVKRATVNKTPWDCPSTVKWIDLGLDFFPRYLRSIECTKQKCWYDRYECKPRSFTVKILRRKNGKCIYSNRREGAYGLPKELRELWVWEERAVNFCCECAKS